MTNQYEAMFIIKPDLSEEEKKNLFNQIGEAITKAGGNVASAAVWSDRKKLFFKLKKYTEGLYYLAAFSAPGAAIADIRRSYQLNENILRVMITALEK